jgi:hypothetical protein
VCLARRLASSMAACPVAGHKSAWSSLGAPVALERFGPAWAAMPGKIAGGSATLQDLGSVEDEDVEPVPIRLFGSATAAVPA